MGRRGEARRAAKTPGEYYAGDLNAQIDRLRQHFTVEDEAEAAQAEARFNVAVSRLYTRLKKFYGYGNKYRADGSLTEDYLKDASKVEVSYADETA